MLFPTFTFAVFFALVYAGHVALRGRPGWWKASMLVASYVFYGWWDWRFLGLIIGSTLVNWWGARTLHRRSGRRRKVVLRLVVAANLALLGFFKYWGFFVESLDQAFGTNNPIPFIDVILPVGISFYTFQALSYVIDVHRKDLKPASLGDVAVYLAFFPQLVAGPIVRAKEFLPQLGQGRLQGSVMASEAAWLIGRGLFKKVVVSTYLADSVVDPVFAAPSAASRLELLQAMYGYAIQIYADFSGYTDIAIGIALLLGFRFPENFNNPYRALSIRDFWRRWHITLSTWLRDYLYISLGGSRRGSILTYRNLLITMVLGGLWHGAAWTFIAWGAIHGGALAVERLTAGRRIRSGAEANGGPTPDSQNSRFGTIIRWFITFNIVSVAWVLFRAETFEQAADFLTGLLTAPLLGPVNWVAVLVIVGALAFQLAPTKAFAQARDRLSDTNPLVQGALLGVWISLVVALGPEGVAPFIYFQF